MIRPQKKKNPEIFRVFLVRNEGLEPTASSTSRKHSTTELIPHKTYRCWCEEGDLNPHIPEDIRS